MRMVPHTNTKRTREATITQVRRSALQRQCACGGTPGPTGKCAECRRERKLGQSMSLQRQLTINQPGDRYEQEADRAADRVLRMPDPHLQPQTRVEEAQIQAKQLLLRQTDPEVEEEDEIVQRKSSELRPATARGEATAPPLVHDVLRSSGQPLDPATRAFMEPRFGYDFSQVRVHSDARASSSAHLVGAKAYTVGHHVVFGEGHYATGTDTGLRLLAHELAHVVQQQGREGRLQRAVKKNPCAVHVYDASNAKDTAVIPKDKSGIGVISVDDMISKVNAYVNDDKNACSCVNRLEINGHGTDGYQSVGNGARYVNDDKALVHDSKEDHLKKLAKINLCGTGSLFMMFGCHVGRGKGKKLQSRIAQILPGKLIGGSQHFTGGAGLGKKWVAGRGDLLDAKGNIDSSKADPFLTSSYVRWHIVIAGKEYIINGTETTSREGKAKLRVGEKIKVKTPEGETIIK